MLGKVSVGGRRECLGGGGWKPVPAQLIVLSCFEDIKMGKRGPKALSAAEHQRRGTWRRDCHGRFTSAAMDGETTAPVMNPDDPETWFVHHRPYEQHLWRRYLESYVPGDRLACYQFIDHQAACESTDYWRLKHGGPPRTPGPRGTTRPSWRICSRRPNGAGGECARADAPRGRRSARRDPA